MALFAHDIDLKTRVDGLPTPILAYCNFVASATSTAQLAQSGHLALSAPSQIIGRFQYLKTLRHPHLCSYVDIHRGKHDRIFVVSEYFEKSLERAESMTVIDDMEPSKLQTLALEILQGLLFLHDLGIVHGCLSPQLILLDTQNHVKLFGYGLNYMTGNGVDIDFPIGYPAYLAPECILAIKARRTDKMDIWSLGIILMEQYTRHSFWTTSDLGLIFNSLSTLAQWAATVDNVWGHKDIGTLDISDAILDFLRPSEAENDLNATTCMFRQFVLKCLEADPKKRATGHVLMSLPFLSSILATQAHINCNWIRGPALISDELKDPIISDVDNEDSTKIAKSDDSLQGLPLSQVYNLWKLAGGDVELDAAKKDAFLTTPVIERLPRLCGLAENTEIGTAATDSAQLYSDTIFRLGYKELYQRLGEERQRSMDSFDWDADYFMVADEDGVDFLSNDGITQQLTNGDNGNVPLEDEFIFADETTSNSHSNNSTNGHSLFSPNTPTQNQQNNSAVIPSSPPPAPPSRTGRRALSFTGLTRSDSNSSISQPSPTNNTPTALTNSAFSTAFGSQSVIPQLATSPSSSNNLTQINHTGSRLPLLLREQDVSYQFRRQALFSVLLLQYPASRKELIHHAKVDIPPLLRGKIWAAILGVRGDVWKLYSNINKCVDVSADRQIDVDVPRCHQYNQLLASSVGHEKLRRLLKAWVSANPDLAYWQGLDSLCAPFLTLHFNDEAMAFACLQLFIPKFLKNFFLSDNAPVLQEYLAIFRHLLSYHDPELSSHLDNIGFMPDLYAIPWFLTLFTHVFPLDQVYHLWDKLLVGPSSLPLFFGIAILRQIRDILLKCEFNDCIVLMSDSFPKVDIEKCVQNAISMCRVTPPSVAARVHDEDTKGSNNKVKLSNGNSKHEYHTTTANTNGTAKSTLESNDASLTNTNGDMHSYDDDDDGDGVLIIDERQWWEQPLSIEIKKKELAPRIDVIDLFHLLPYCLVLDIRSEQAFTREHIPSSMNVQDQQLQSYALTLKKMNRKYHVVMADDERGAEFSAELVRRHFPRVAMLQGGICALEDNKGSIKLCHCRPQKQTKPGFKGKEPPFIIWRCKVPTPLVKK